MIRQRNIAVCIILSLVTCGIYGIYWFVCLTDETNIAAQENGTSGGMTVLLTIITCGIYGLYWAYKCGEKIDRAHNLRGEPASNGGILYLLVYIFGGIITYALIQNELNKFVEKDMEF